MSKKKNKKKLTHVIDLPHAEFGEFGSPSDILSMVRAESAPTLYGGCPWLIVLNKSN